MTKNQLANLRQEIRLLTGRRFSLERTAMGFVPMLPASLLERRFRKNGPAAYYLSIPNSQGTSRHRYVRKNDVEMVRRQTEAWREFSRAMAEWVRVTREVERLLRRIGEGRCLNINLGGRQ
jgi:hypothetical protein